MEDDRVELNNPHVQQKQSKIVIFGGGFIGIIVLLCIYAVLFMPDPAKPVLSDRDLYLTYYSNLMAKASTADQIYNPFAEALEKQDVLGATQLALKIKNPINNAWSQIENSKPPILKNEAASKKLIEAHEAISGAYMYKSSIVSDFIDLAESQSIKKLAEMTNKAESIQTLTLGGTVRLVEAGTMIGINLDEISKR